MLEAFETVSKILVLVGKINGADMKLALIATLFDHVCEIEHLDKTKTAENLFNAIRDVGAKFGSMYKEVV